MGQGDFHSGVSDAARIWRRANSPSCAFLHDFLVKLNPEPHRRAFLKPFMQGADGGVLLDVPQGSPRRSGEPLPLDSRLQRVRQLAGQRSFGQGARSFYYPPKPQQCADCHMPLVASNDFGNIDGRRHSHRFPAANTALPTANEDPEQLKATEGFPEERQSDAWTSSRIVPALARDRAGAMMPAAICRRLSRSAKKAETKSRRIGDGEPVRRLPRR